MAAVLAKGKTTIYNAACEPYLQQLSKMLNSMGVNADQCGLDPTRVDRSAYQVRRPVDQVQQRGLLDCCECVPPRSALLSH